MNTEQLEELARQFRKDTGLLAPFKDAPVAVGGDPEYNQTHRREEWDKWLGRRQRKVNMWQETVMTETEQDSCTPTDEEVEAYLAEPDDEVAAKLRATEPPMFRVIGRCLLYGRNIAKAQAQITGDIAYKAGIEKVVKWVEKNHGDLGTLEQPVLTLNGWKWQAFKESL